MQNYIKLYLKFFDYKIPSDAISEISGQIAVDVHHIQARGMGGSKSKDTILNLIALTRTEHDKAESGEYSKDFLTGIHYRFILNNGFAHKLCDEDLIKLNRFLMKENKTKLSSGKYLSKTRHERIK